MPDAPRRLESAHVVRTPEYVEFEFPIAGLMSRTLAWLIDVLLSTAFSVTILVVLWMTLNVVPGVAAALSFLVWFLVMWGYFIVVEFRWAGQTIGKRVLSLRVIQESGVRIGFYESALRNLVRAIDNLPLLYLVGGTTALFSAKARRLGDYAAGTVVVKERRRKVPAGLLETGSVDALLQSDKKLEDRLRSASSDEREVLISAALRREELALEARLSLFHTLAAYLTERFSIARAEHLSEEKFVLEITSILIRQTHGLPPAKGRVGPRRAGKP